MFSLKERVSSLHSLPAMPETASAVLNLRTIPDVNIEEVLDVIEKDPLLVAQIIRYANSAFFGQTGSINSLKDAVFRVLGLDTVMNMALALSVGASFTTPNYGPVGALSVWKSSMYSAALMQRLTMLMPWGERPNPGTAYLVGLLNNIGLFVLGHLFTEEYEIFNNHLEKFKEEDFVSAEANILGISHLNLGKKVMRMWNMPEEIIAAMGGTDDIELQDEHKQYLDLLAIVNILLSRHELSFTDHSVHSFADLLSNLKLDESDVLFAADEILQEAGVIDDLVKQMCA